MYLGTAIDASIKALLANGLEVDTGHWQGVPTDGRPDLRTKELVHLAWACPSIPPDLTNAADVVPYWRSQVKPNLPWADDHFEERVSRVPSNPGEQYKNWPWWHGQTLETMEIQDSVNKEVFTHTYQERFWPKRAGQFWSIDDLVMPGDVPEEVPAYGIRYDYGDLDDVVSLLLREPYTRQAYLPIFFPEDTGAVHGGRIPCTLGYHFMLRENRLHMWYTIRSCDAVRHFRDDVYLALRLLLWVLDEVQFSAMELQNQLPPEDVSEEVEVWRNVIPGNFYFTAFSFHLHMGDLHRLREV